MNPFFLRNYFPVIKFGFQFILMVYIAMSRTVTDAELSIQVCLIAMILLCSTIYEGRDSGKWGWLLAEGALIGGIYLFAAADVILLLPFWLLDLGIGLLNLHQKMPVSIFLLPMLGLFSPQSNKMIYFFCSFFCSVFYLQHFLILEYYRNQIKSYKREEDTLKDTINHHEVKLKEELLKRSLGYENRILEERARLSQELHDKLGHSINGSIYQLEAGKVLLFKDQEKSLKIIQEVVDSLRIGMEEIRAILRKEKPDKTQMAILQLHGLSAECREKFGIEMELDVQGESSLITAKVWDVILDNVFEAVTNALKYSQCEHIKLELKVLNKLVRCRIHDDGLGCSKLEAGMGIEGMKQRVRRLNGTMDIDLSNGFAVSMLIPNDG